MQDRFITALLAIVISMAISGINAITGITPTVDNGGDDALGCDMLFAYLTDLGTAVIDHPTYIDWFIEDGTEPIDELNPADAEEIVEDGVAFVDDISGIDPPAVYAEGHEGIVAVFTFFNATITWVVLEEGDEPDTQDLSDAFELIVTGEEAAADGCPDEVEELDGAVFIDPAEIDVEDVPEDPGDVDKNFL